MSILTIDIGGSLIKYAFMEPDNTILERGTMPTPMSGRKDLRDALSALFRLKNDVVGIAISLPGIIDAENGYIVMGGALRYNDDFYLRHELYAHCRVPMIIENDANCAGLAEATLGSLKDIKEGYVIVLGTMIGGAYIKDRKVQRGHHFAAGEISYINTLRDEVPTEESIWGNRCGTAGLCARYAIKKGLPVNSVDGYVFFDALSSGDPAAAECLTKFARELAMQIFNLQTILDPERFAIGGGISARAELIDAVRKQLDILYDACPYRIPRAEVVTSKFQNDANLVGALQTFLDKYKDIV